MTNDLVNQLEQVLNVSKDSLAHVMTIKEASQLWKLDTSTICKSIKAGKFHPDECRRSGATWLITSLAMTRLYGIRKELTHEHSSTN